MVQYIKMFAKVSLLVLGGLALYSCESDADNLGSQFFVDGMTKGTQASYDLIAYNINNGDKIQTDATKLLQATLGAFREPVFGGQKSSYVTQVRMNSYNPVFGENVVLDSVVLVLKPAYISDSVKVSVDDNYLHSTENIPAKKIVKTYPVVKYGKENKSLTININEVDEFLGSVNDTIYSDRKIKIGKLLGTRVLEDKISAVTITKDADNTELANSKAEFRIPLDKDFFKNKILNKQGSQELSDASNFIRYFKGIRISVEENDGYIFKYNPNDVEMIMYYTRDVKTKDKVTPVQTSMNFSLGSGNVHFNQIEYDRNGSVVANANFNANDGDAKLYPQGMGGLGVGIRIPEETIEHFRKLYKDNGIAILSAKMRIYSDDISWEYTKPNVFTVLEKNSDKFLSDISEITGNLSYNLVKVYDIKKNPRYYDISITQTFKNIIEKDKENKDFVLNVGDFEVNTNSNRRELLGTQFTTTPYTPDRVILVGTDATNENRIKLNVIYTKK